jgi:hypothetical protein
MTQQAEPVDVRSFLAGEWRECAPTIGRKVNQESARVEFAPGQA